MTGGDSPPPDSKGKRRKDNDAGAPLERREFGFENAPRFDGIGRTWEDGRDKTHEGSRQRLGLENVGTRFITRRVELCTIRKREYVPTTSRHAAVRQCLSRRLNSNSTTLHMLKYSRNIIVCFCYSSQLICLGRGMPPPPSLLVLNQSFSHGLSFCQNLCKPTRGDSHFRGHVSPMFCNMSPFFFYVTCANT